MIGFRIKIGQPSQYPFSPSSYFNWPSLLPGLLPVSSFPLGIAIIHGYGMKRMESGGVNLQLYIGFKPR